MYAEHCAPSSIKSVDRFVVLLLTACLLSPFFPFNTLSRATMENPLVSSILSALSKHIFFSGLILVPNGKWLGKQMGDRYLGEEALATDDLESHNYAKWAHEGPGGRLYAKGQVDEETKILTQFKDPSRVNKSSALS